jgi:hypothetical protein
MSSNSIIKKAKLNEWASRISDQKASGLSVSNWCRQNEISQDKFFYWKRKLKDEVIDKALPDIVQIALPSATDPTSSAPSVPTKDEITHSTRATCTSCTSCTSFPIGTCARIYINGMTVEFEASAPEVLINSLLKALRHV